MLFGSNGLDHVDGPGGGADDACFLAGLGVLLSVPPHAATRRVRASSAAIPENLRILVKEGMDRSLGWGAEGFRTTLRQLL